MQRKLSTAVHTWISLIELRKLIRACTHAEHDIDVLLDLVRQKSMLAAWGVSMACSLASSLRLCNQVLNIALRHPRGETTSGNQVAGIIVPGGCDIIVEQQHGLLILGSLHGTQHALSRSCMQFVGVLMALHFMQSTLLH